MGKKKKKTQNKAVTVERKAVPEKKEVSEGKAVPKAKVTTEAKTVPEAKVTTEAKRVAAQEDGAAEAISMVDVDQGESLSDDNPSYGSYADNMLINSILQNDPAEGDRAASESLVFGKKSYDDSKVCPNCGMPLVGKSNYCMGCGKNVDPIKGSETSGRANPYDGAHIDGVGYGGGNAYVAREEALKKRRKKRKRNILEENGLAGFLMKFFGIVAGFIIGFLVLKWYFAPEDVAMTLYREAKVAKIANVKSIAAGTKSDSLDIFGRNGKTGSKTGNAQSVKTETQTTGQTASGTFQKQKNQYFYGTLRITAKGDRILEWEEEETWDTAGLDDNDVSYVINNLNHEYESLLNQIFINFEITREGETVTMRFQYRHLDLAENARAMVQLGIVSGLGLDGNAGKEHLSLRKTLEIFDGDGWRTEKPAAMETPAPSADPSGDPATEKTNEK